MPHFDLTQENEQLYHVAAIFDKLPINIRIAGYSDRKPNFRNAIFPEHTVYNCHHLEYITDGSGSIELDDTKLHFSKGDFFFIRKGQNRTIIGDQGSSLSKYYIAANGFLLDALLSSYGLTDKGLVINIDLEAEFKEIFEIIKSSPQDDNVSTLCDAIGVIIMKMLQKIHHSRFPSIHKPSTNIAFMIQDYIETNLAHNLTIEELCDRFHLGKTQLFKVFKKQFLITPLLYHQKRKIDVAKVFIKIYNTKTSEIAEFLGFSDTLYFTKVFRRHTGMTVREYKKAISHNPSEMK